jgi:hypothetical protein
LSADRLAAFRGVIDVLDDAKVMGVDAARTEEAVTALRSRYATGPPLVKTAIEVALDAVDSLVADGQFTSRSTSERHRLLLNARSQSGSDSNRQPFSSQILDAMSIAVAPFIPEGVKWSPGAIAL